MSKLPIASLVLLVISGSAFAQAAPAAPAPAAPAPTPPAARTAPPATRTAPPTAAPAPSAAATAPAQPVVSPALASLTDARIQAALQSTYSKVKGVQEGKNADYIPVLAKVDPKLFGIALVTADGRIHQIGDAQHPFSIQSVAKVFTLARLLQDLGPEAVEKKIGVNPTGHPFNSVLAIELNKEHLPGNPLVNAGAITAVSMVPGLNADERWTKILGTMNLFSGRALTLDDEVYRNESATNTHNRAIAWLLKDYKAIAGDPLESLDLYTRECSVSVTARDLAIMGATLASGGINPLTRKRVIEEAYAPRVMAVMLENGLYDGSGDWAYRVGVPAKSGVGGGIVAVVPGQFAVATFSPPLDEAGNSVRGQLAIQSIIEQLGGNVFAGTVAPRGVGGTGK